MNSPSLTHCPKCGKTFLSAVQWNSNYVLYVHKQEPGHKGWTGLIEYCIVLANYNYSLLKEEHKSVPINPNCRTTKPPE